MMSATRKTFSYLSLALLLAVFTTIPNKAQPSDASAEQAIETANKQFMEAFSEGDADAITALYTDEAVLLIPHQDPLEGHEAVANYMRGAIEQGLTEIDLETTEVTQHGNMAVEMGEYTLFAGDRRVDQGKYLVVWRRESDTWKLHRDMMNTSMPQEQAAGQPMASKPSGPPEGCALNNTFQCATPITAGEQDQNSFSNREYYRYYKLNVEEPGVKTFTLDPMPNAVRIQAAIHDSNYNKITEHRWQAGQPGSYEMNFSSPGTFYLELRAYPQYKCANSSACSYTLALSQ